MTAVDGDSLSDMIRIYIKKKTWGLGRCSPNVPAVDETRIDKPLSISPFVDEDSRLDLIRPDTGSCSKELVEAGGGGAAAPFL